MTDMNLMKKLFEQLIQEERRGKRFFGDAAQFVSDPAHRSVFEYLTQAEEKHLESLSTMRETMVNSVGAAMRTIKRSETDVYEFGGKETFVFMIDGSEITEIELPHLELFKAGDFQALFNELSVGNILKYAMQIEYDNAKYILEFMKHIKDRRFINLLRKLADEEKEHFIVLRKQYDRLPASLK